MSNPLSVISVNKISAKGNMHYCSEQRHCQCLTFDLYAEAHLRAHCDLMLQR